MKKRIVCVLLTLIMLMSLVPMGASAASHSISAAAITVLKQMTTLKTECYHYSGSEYRTGYGTVCTEEHHFKTNGDPDNTDGQNEHKITQAKADTALRDALKVLDKKVNDFASANGKNLSQHQHDALVVFSYNAGSGWMDGNGVVKTAILNNANANELLNAMALWSNTTFGNTTEMNRRKVEVNMYMNGVYSNTASSNYIAITYNLKTEDEGYANIPQGNGYTMYYDASGPLTHIPTATHATKKFVGWYGKTGVWSPVAHNGINGTNVYAGFMNLKEERAASFEMDATFISPKTVYTKSGDKFTADKTQYKLISGKSHVWVEGEYLDGSGNHWCKLDDNAWVKVSPKSTGYASAADDGEIIATVTVTNSYVNRRVNASASSAKNGSYSLGKKLDILAEDDGWLQVGEKQSDGSMKAVGWVSAMYTNWGSTQESTGENVSTNVIGTATVTFNGYLNIRQEPGTDAKILGALAKSDSVDVYEIKTVNGHRWGRIKSGWICLTYTDLTTKTNANISDAGLKLYAFTGKMTNGDMTALVAAGPYNNPAQYQDPDKVMHDLVIEEGKTVTVTNLAVVDGDTWAKATWTNDEWKYNSKKEKVDTTATRSGWVKLSSVIAMYGGSSAEIALDPVKYTVAADSINVRTDAGDAYGLLPGLNTLNKGTQVVVTEIKLVGENIWGKFQATASETGWINLASKYVTRNDVPNVPQEAGQDTGKMATVINTDSLRVRATGATYGQQIGSLSRGTTVAVWEYDDGWYKVDSNKNGKFDYDGDGWVSEAYVEISTGSANGNTTVTDAAGNKYETDGTGKGIVANTYSGVNVRTGPSTAYAANGKLLPGTVVEILETANAGKWGRTAQGWVSMDYITMITYNQAATTNKGETVVGSYADAQKTTTTAVYTGTMVGTVEVYRNPTMIDAELIRKGTEENITIYELAAVTEKITSDETTVGDTTTTTTITETTYWARINDGWVKNPEENIVLNALDEKVHTQTHTETLKVRNAPETGDVIDALAQGDQVRVTALKIVKDKVWGRVETDEGTGWIRLDYMSEGAVTVKKPVTTTVTAPTIGTGSSTGGYVNNTSGYRYTGKITNANEVNVRATPSTGAAKTTTMKNGQALVVYETTIAENMAWGRCDAGWVYLYYVDLTPVVNGAVDARVVYNDNTIIYSDVNGSAVAGTYSRMSVVDIYEIVGKMARTDKGWISTDNLL